MLSFVLCNVGNLLEVASYFENQLQGNTHEEEEIVFVQPPNIQFSEDTISLVAQFSVNRLARFEGVIKSWPGPISAVIYLTEASEIPILHNYFQALEDPNLYDRVTLTLVKPRYDQLERYQYPINRLRNLGIKAAHTTYIYVMDVDFIPSPQLYQYARDHLVDMISKSTQPIAFVVPCVAIQENYSGVFPATVADLQKLFTNGDAYITDPRAGHGPTQYGLLLTPSIFRSKPYYEVCFESQWEPYYIVSKKGLHPLYDERFKNQGGDKQQHALHLNALGYRFLVLKDHFMYHLDHAKFSWPGGGFRSKQNTATFNFFGDYLPEMRRRFGSTFKWPRGCQNPFVLEQKRSLLGAAMH
ncbi:hypothetical protein K493DRAFT_366931 [Basidiobolus meristosporus CBS 931.73]|uniref:Glycosyltransferase family 49 protein n=1 Tax=Basidiobolus meristosporus CBS 931.73 TaxID=1314790 RepID=A0A1Y1ZAR3_9FUNG|nr:hypothetical protein K493DRAFT_366931 [Basidiobolus meristosporus CBS 931.73]|eukprot:ORY07087.1 hypothetical protein K493DRAFT_366931 [Basidiobolus meristosporus CBS 931.73]